MTIDQRTPHLGLPLPHPLNNLEDDLPRVSAAFVALDQKIAALDALLTSDDINLDTVQELVSAIKAARTEVGTINALIADQLVAQNTAIANQLAVQNLEVSARLSAISALVYAGL